MKISNKSYNAKAVASIPVQSRIDIQRLAEMTMYFDSKGIQITSMSQLVSWTVEIAVKILKDNQLMPCIVDRIDDANEILEIRGLYQPGMQSRGRQKLVTAMKFENLIDAGLDPRTAAPLEFNNTIKSTSVKTITDETKELATTGAGMSEALRIYKELEERDNLIAQEKLAEQTNRQRQVAINSGRVVKVKGEFNDPEELMQRARANDEALKNF